MSFDKLKIKLYFEENNLTNTIELLSAKVKKLEKTMLKELAEFLVKKVLWHIGESPESSDSKGDGIHSKKGLDRLGNPYSRLKNKDPHKSEGIFIHYQTGDLYDSIALKNSEEFIDIFAKRAFIRIWSDDPVLLLLKVGTSKMIPRDIETFIWNKYKKDIVKIVNKYWKDVKI